MRLLTLFCVLCFSMSNVTHAQSISERKKQSMQGKERGDRGSQAQEQISGEARKRFAEVQRQMRSGEIKFIGDKPTFRIKLNPALNYALKDLTGAKDEMGAVDKYSRISPKISQLEKSFVDEALKKGIVKLPTCLSSYSNFDWRSLGKVTSVKNQGGCGSCPYFATLAAWEGSHAIRNGVLVDASEQRLLSCTTGDCTGWNLPGVANEMVSNGTATEAAYPYTASNTSCNASALTPYNAINSADVNGWTPTDEEIQQAICDHGPVAVAIFASAIFQAYGSGIFNEFNNPVYTDGSAWDGEPVINHFVAIVGWSDSQGGYWIAKNSWGTGWGERGYVRIAYGSNNIGSGARWIDAPYLKIMSAKQWREAFRKEIPGYPLGGR